MPSPLFTVVTPSFNQGRFIRRNIESVLEQNFADVEHIVMDGGSTDDTVAILKQYPSLVWVSEPDRGQSHALNKAIARARGEWIVWINSDDYLLPGALRAFSDFLARRPDAQFVYSDGIFVDDEGRELSRRPADFSREDFLHLWRRGIGFKQPGSFFRKSLWERHGPIDESLQYAMDYDFALKLLDHVEFLYLPGYLATYRLHGDAKTAEGWRPFTRENIIVLRRYWDQRGGFLKWYYRARLPFIYGRKLVNEGMQCWERGEKKRAWRLWLEGRTRNPLSFFSRPHLLFRLRQLLGRARYERLRIRLLGPRPLDPQFPGNANLPIGASSAPPRDTERRTTPSAAPTASDPSPRQ